MPIHQVVFSIADTVFALQPDKPLSPAALESLNRFLSTSEPQVTIRVREGEFPELLLRPEDKLFDSEDLWSLYRADRGVVIVITTPHTAPRPFRVAFLDSDRGRIEIFVGPAEKEPRQQRLPIFPFEHPIAQILMVWTLARGRGLMTHSCGVNDQGKGYLFAGNSGHGKSTIAQPWKDHAEILNDDRIVLGFRQGRPWMFGTPWHGDYRGFSAAAVPVEKVFFLVKAERNKAVEVTGMRAASMLLTRSFPPLWDDKGMNFTLDLIARLIERVPCHELHFQPDDSVVDFVRSVR